jgi:hypothetical protein
VPCKSLFRGQNRNLLFFFDRKSSNPRLRPFGSRTSLPMPSSRTSSGRIIKPSNKVAANLKTIDLTTSKRASKLPALDLSEDSEDDLTPPPKAAIVNYSNLEYIVNASATLDNKEVYSESDSHNLFGFRLRVFDEKAGREVKAEAERLGITYEKVSSRTLISGKLSKPIDMAIRRDADWYAVENIVKTMYRDKVKGLYVEYKVVYINSAPVAVPVLLLLGPPTAVGADGPEPKKRKVPEISICLTARLPLLSWKRKWRRETLIELLIR